MQPSSWWCPACRTDGSAVPALATLESLVLRLVFLDTACCHLWWSSSCSRSSSAFWLGVVWQTGVTCKPYHCPRVLAAGGKANCSPWGTASPHMAHCCNVRFLVGEMLVYSCGPQCRLEEARSTTLVRDVSVRMDCRAT